MKRAIALCVMFLLFQLVSCADAAVVLPAGATMKANVAYGSDALQKMNVFIPANAKRSPLILMVHGGGWDSGDKADTNVVQNKVPYFLNLGFVFVSMNYRLVPQAKPTDEAADVKSAIAYIQKNAKTWNADPNKIVLMGHSAGGNLVTLAQSPAVLGAVILDSAGYDIPSIMAKQHLALYDTAFDHDTAQQQAASPTLQLKAKPVPMLLVCDIDRRNACDQANAYAAAAKKYGAALDVYPVHLTHEAIDADVGLPNALTNHVASFLNTLRTH